MIEHAVTIIDQTMNNCEKEKVSYTQYESSSRRNFKWVLKEAKREGRRRRWKERR